MVGEGGGSFLREEMYNFEQRMPCRAANASFLARARAFSQRRRPSHLTTPVRFRLLRTAPPFATCTWFCWFGGMEGVGMEERIFKGKIVDLLGKVTSGFERSFFFVALLPVTSHLGGGTERGSL